MIHRRSHRRIVLVVVAISCAGAQRLAVSSADEARALPERIEFNRDVRPILSDKCFACHGPDKNKREADLRLDTRDGLLGAGDESGVVVPNDPAESELLRRVTSEDAAERMPPEESGKSLSATEIATLQRWIEQGAVWEGHWSFNPIKPVEPPVVDDSTGFVRGAIDQFALQAMRSHGLSSSPVAEPRTLVRRLSLDLTGLPPSSELVERFAGDPSPENYERVVDELLASHHYGERMAMWWLDLVRYADSVGYHGDQEVSVFPFREYVIRSFQENKPFDQFTREQLAGDLLPEPTLEQRVASGYNRLGMMSAEGGVQDKEYLAKYVAERVRNLGGTWLGATLGCCECHNHKFDPFTAKDFYSLEAFFADIKERGLYSGANADGNWGPRVQVPTSDQVRRLAELDGQIAAARATLATQTPELDAAQQVWEQSQVAWTVLRPRSLASAAGATLTVLDDGSILASGASPRNDNYLLAFADPPEGITAVRLEVLPHESLPQQGPGRAANGNFVLTEIQATLKPAGEEAIEQPITLRNATATHEQSSGAEGNPDGKWAVAATIDGDARGPNGGWAILDQTGKPNMAVFECAEDVACGEGTTLTIALQHNSEHVQHTLGRFRVSVTRAPHPVKAGDSPPIELAEIMAIGPEQRSDEQRSQLAAYYRSIAPLLEPARVSLKQLDEERTALDQSIPTTLVAESVEPRMIRILARGNWMDESGEVVSPAFPGFLPQPDAAERRLTRLDLADWLVSPENPLTARVFVNRVWKLCFGTGLSRKLDDLGAQGEWPSHPELLDWLAADFRDHGWDVKRLVKQMVMSGTYRQASLADARAREMDPFNRWLARQARFRLDAELVRDNALAISGLLVDRVGGPSARPYQPPGYWAYLNFPQREWRNSTGEGLYRRGLYTHWQRQYLHPSLLAFDAPSREECSADRTRSNTPLQALVLLNDPTYVESARAFAAKILLEGGPSTEGRIDWAFQRAVMRPAREAETALLAQLVDKHLAEYRDDPAAVEALLLVGEYRPPAELDRAELAAWTSAARTILNLHETVTRN